MRILEVEYSVEWDMEFLIMRQLSECFDVFDLGGLVV